MNCVLVSVNDALVDEQGFIVMIHLFIIHSSTASLIIFPFHLILARFLHIDSFWFSEILQQSVRSVVVWVVLYRFF